MAETSRKNRQSRKLLRENKPPYLHWMVMFGCEAIWPHERTSRDICAPLAGRAQRIRPGHPCIGSSAGIGPLVRRPIGEGLCRECHIKMPKAFSKGVKNQYSYLYLCDIMLKDIVDVQVHGVE
ncbi:hypothetical protein NPIL_427441 [Nephila pilipes]|uniref:Uncharacterized protein n=1 Tax=Nephila pilipes TaxID=299642 RepID=A0A8X6U3R7_NEPPI|nr:hypothetical protein NPIL_427441 [Nephila pilipes]